MIEINLLPEELRNRVVKQVKPEPVRVDSKPGLQQLILLVPVIFILIFIAHIYLFFLGVIKVSHFNALNAKWERMLPERKSLEDFNNQQMLYSGSDREIQRFLNERVLWAQKLSRLSSVLPPGIWLKSMSVSGKVFQLQGKAVSLKKEEVVLIRSFIDDLKSRPNFINNFNSLELGAIQKEAIGSYEVADFTLTGSLK